MTLREKILEILSPIGIEYPLERMTILLEALFQTEMKKVIGKDEDEALDDFDRRPRETRNELRGEQRKRLEELCSQ